MLQSLSRLLANEEEESAAAEQLDVSLQTLPWARRRDNFSSFSWFPGEIQLNLVLLLGTLSEKNMTLFGNYPYTEADTGPKYMYFITHFLAPPTKI